MQTDGNIYVRPKGEDDLSLVDDLSADAVKRMKATGFVPAAVVETSPETSKHGLVRHPHQLPRELSTMAARKLAEDFGGDRGAADWRHFGRLAGFTNRKTGLACGLLLKALQNGHRCQFVRAQDLFDEMYASLADRSTRQLLNRLARRADRLFAAQLYDRGLPLTTVENAMILAAARRSARPADAAPLGTIRSLAYFARVIEEVLQLKIGPEYFRHLRNRLQRSTPAR